MKLTDNALTVLKRRYFKKDKKGKVLENWEDLVKRVSNNIAKGDVEKSKRYFRLLDSGNFLPNSPTLMNAGNDLQQLSACFVLPVEDSMESIFESVKNAALIHKSGGGTGFSFSKLRQSNARVKSTSGVSSGPITFLKVFNSATDAVKQGGTRRGANMAILNVDHPDIMEFITCKEDTSELTNFNISVGITAEFMNAFYEDDEYELTEPHTGKIIKKLRARDVFSLIVEMAHKNGEPGVIFLDRINEYNPTPHIGKIESTNPCGEQPLLSHEACNLGSINLAGMVKQGEIDYKLLEETVRESVDFLNDVIDRSKFPLEMIDKMVKGNRKIGLGIMGWADLLFLLNIPYSSDEAIDLASSLMEFIDFTSKKRSMELAQAQGAFPNFKGSIYEKSELKRKKLNLNWDALGVAISENGIRNATTTTIAPTGTISMIMDTSSGIEPQFSLVYVKQVMDGDQLLYVNPHFEKALKEAGIYSEDLMKKISDAGSIQQMEEIPERIRKVFVTSHDISPEWHIRMQAAFQQYTDNAVSKTINFTREATPENIKTAYEMAYQSGCKGVTVYRDGSRENQVLNIGSKIKKSMNGTRISPRKRPVITQGTTQKIETGCGNMYITINSDKNGACEVFTQIGKVGGCASAQLEAIARLTSLCLRSNVKLSSIIKQLSGIRCPSPMWSKGEMITSCADGVAKSLKTFMEMSKNADNSLEEINIKADDADKIPSGKLSGLCPDCGSTIEHSEGCMKCNNCGWTKC
ncbi:MAG: ribonucleotide-diphosphate reductase subunit alpha [Candidatus Cloacimonas sp. SDB]|nr:MAG: ribonucleotide-diphosphate reductase subunit alpha [Candidatus Cloacimonas sp. SDB]